MAKKYVVDLRNVSPGYLVFRGRIQIRPGEKIRVTLSEEEYRFYSHNPLMCQVGLVKVIDNAPKVSPEKLDAAVKSTDATDDPQVLENIRNNFRDSADNESDETVREETPATEDIEGSSVDDNKEKDPDVQGLKNQFDSLTKTELINFIKQAGLAEDFKAATGKAAKKATKKELKEFLINTYKSTINNE